MMCYMTCIGWFGAAITSGPVQPGESRTRLSPRLRHDTQKPVSRRRLPSHGSTVILYSSIIHYVPASLETLPNPPLRYMFVGRLGIPRRIAKRHDGNRHENKSKTHVTNSTMRTICMEVTSCCHKSRNDVPQLTSGMS